MTLKGYRHKGYSLMKPMPVKRFLTQTRRALVRDIGGTEDNLSAQQVILIDGCINVLGIIRCMELYVSKKTVMEGKLLAPCLRNSYLQYRSLLHKTLAMLGLERKQVEAIVLTPLEIAEEEDQKEEKRVRKTSKRKHRAKK